MNRFHALLLAAVLALGSSCYVPATPPFLPTHKFAATTSTGNNPVISLPLPASKTTGQKGAWVRVPERTMPYGCVAMVAGTGTWQVAIEGSLDDDPNHVTPVFVASWFVDSVNAASPFTAAGIGVMSIITVPPKWVRVNLVAYSSDSGLAVSVMSVLNNVRQD